MAIVGDQDLSVLLGNHHPILMEWTGQAEHTSGPSRGIPRQGEEIPSYVEHFSQTQLSFPNAPMTSHYDTYHPPKVEPLTGTEYEYYPPQVGPSGPYQVGSGGNSFVSHLPTTDAFDNHPSPVQPQHGGGGALEEIDGLLRKFPEVPQQDLEPFDLGFSHHVYGGTGSDQSPSFRHMSHIPGLLGGGGGVPVVSPQHSRSQWITDPQEVLETSQGFGSDNLVYEMARETRMSNFYPDVPRTQLGASPSNWSVSSSMKPGGHLPTSTQLQFHSLVPKPTQQQHSKQRLGTSGLGASAFSQSDPNPFLRPVGGFGSGNRSMPLPLHQLNISQLPGSNALLNPLAEQILPQSPVPATGLELVHLLLACAEAFAENKLNDAEVILARLRSHVLPGGNPMQRLAAYFEQALTARLTKENSSPIFKGFTGDRSLPQAELLEAFSVYYDCIPIGKFGHLTCNQILLDAVEREKAIHVLDLHIWHGMQWPAFLQALALRPGGPPKLRISAVGSDLSDLNETGEKLQECAETLKVSFEYCPILTNLEDFSSNMVETRRGESLVINSFVQFHRILNKSPNSLGKLLSDLRLLNPKVLAFAENDGNHNHQSFLTRFVECLRYYSAVFDAFDASLPPDSPARMKMEQIFAAQKIRNIIACEGPDRVDGHEPMKHWHKRLEAAQFRCVPLSHRAVSQANLLLNLYYSSGYTLNTSDCGYLALGWHGMPLTGVSAWR